MLATTVKTTAAVERCVNMSVFTYNDRVSNDDEPLHPAFLMSFCDVKMLHGDLFILVISTRHTPGCIGFTFMYCHF